ncbi:hypothetical protein ERJ75_000656800 [Trypanosoma vivax]|nr:hypothetical protein ERJ75_000656800 [Trypanosoma vivax]
MRVATPTFSGALPTLFLLVLPRGRRVCLLISLTHTFRRRASRSPTNSVRLRLHATRPRSTILGSYAASIPNQGQAPMLPSGACSHAPVSHALACLSLVSAVSAQNTPPRLASAKCSCRTFARFRALLQGLVPAVQLPSCADWHSQPPDLVLAPAVVGQTGVCPASLSPRAVFVAVSRAPLARRAAGHRGFVCAVRPLALCVVPPPPVPRLRLRPFDPFLLTLWSVVLALRCDCPCLRQLRSARLVVVLSCCQ